MPGDRPRFDLPDQDDSPLVWDARSRSFVPLGAPAAPEAASAAPAPPPGEPSRAASSPRPGGARRQWHVGPEHVGRPLPPREGGGPPGTEVAPRAGAAAAAPAAPAPPVPRPRPAADRPASPAEAPPKARARRRRRWRPRLLRRPKLRWILLLFSLLPVLLLVGGWLYASALFGRIDRVDVSGALSPPGGGGTNYLIVGSDSRDAVVEQGGTDPNVQPDAEAPSGQRSDTMMILRTTADGALTMSIPRDLFVTHLDGGQGRINAAFNDGPAALIDTIEANLDIPIHRYVEVDFVTFGSLVDALGGVTLSEELVPCPVFDPASGLNLTEPGPVTVDGQQALAFVRSRQHHRVCNGVEEVDPTGDLGRIQRQQGFLRTVLAEAGASRNPITLARVGSALTNGLRIDDDMTLWQAIRFAWDMGKLDPVSVELPTFPFRTSGGAAVLGLVEDEAAAVLDQFR